MKRLLIVALCFLLYGCSNNEGSTEVTEPNPSITTEAATEENNTENEAKESAKQSLKDSGVDVTFQNYYRNDKTEKMKLARIACGVTADEYALDYYKGYFESDEEIHSVVNFSLNTTTCIKVMSGILFVDTYDYVSKEEHDASAAFTGTHLASWQINLETEEIEKID